MEIPGTTERPGSGQAAGGIAPGSTQRIQVLDALRGLCLVVMAIAHVPQSAWVRYTSEAFGYISALSGFIFISGFVAGMVYGSTQTTQGLGAVKKRAFGRAWQIYLAHGLIWTVLLTLALCLPKLEPPRQHLANIFAQPLASWLLGVLFLYQPRFLDILPMYCLLFVVLPYALHLVHRGGGRLVLLLALAVWTAGQWPLRYPVELWGRVNLGEFNVLGWQLVFVTGLVLGYKRRTVGKVPIPNSALLFWVSVIVCLPLFVLRHEHVLFGHTQRVLEFTGFWVSRANCGPLRMLNFAAFAYGTYWILLRAGKMIEHWRLFKWLARLGRHSLQVFSWSILVCVVLEVFERQWQTLGAATGTWLTACVLLSLWVPVRLHELYRSQIAGAAGKSGRAG